MGVPRDDVHDASIERLVGDLQPVRPVSVLRLSAMWLVAQVGFVLLIATAMARPDLLEAVTRPLFLGELLVFLLGGLCAGLLAIRAAVPAREPSVSATAFVLGLGVAAMLLFAFERLVATGFWPLATGGWPCGAGTLAVAALPCAILTLILRGGAPVAPVRAGLLAGAAGLFFAAATLRTTCPGDDALHLLVWHGVPVAAGVVLAGLVATRLLDRWWKRPWAGRRREGSGPATGGPGSPT